MAPSPKKQRVTRSSFRYLQAKARPQASGTCAPTTTEIGEVQRFVKGALIDGAVAEKAKGNAVFISIFAGESETAGQRHMRTHDHRDRRGSTLRERRPD